MKLLNAILLSSLIALSLLVFCPDADSVPLTTLYGRDGVPGRRVGGGAR